MSRGRWAAGLALSLCLLSAVAAFAPAARTRDDDRKSRTAVVRRADFDAVLVAVGRLQSSESTEIVCTLERLANGGAATILSLIPDGTTVKQGDVLGELDSSAFQELVRQQTITVQQARAARRQAELDLEVARIQVEAFRSGEMRQNDRLFRSQILLAQGDLTRQVERLGWTRRMLEKGYAPLLQVRSDELTMQRTALALEQVQTSFRNYLRFTAPMQILSLESVVNAARVSLDFQTIRLRREEERLALYQSMVDRCTIRAPHDGMVIYANRPGRAPEVDLGATVRQRQKLFTLPDLTKMEVQVLLHETVVNRVKVGMPVRVQVEAMPGLPLEGVIKSIGPLPYSDRRAETGSTDVTYFQGQVELTTTPEGLRPGMTAELKITTTRRRGVLVVPPSAVTIEGGHHVCRVVRPDHVERRAVTLGEASQDLQEITDGLDEGEVVLLDPARAAVTAPPPPPGPS
jgi:HlyD family secretion protein